MHKPFPLLMCDGRSESTNLNQPYRNQWNHCVFGGSRPYTKHIHSSSHRSVQLSSSLPPSQDGDGSVGPGKGRHCRLCVLLPARHRAGDRLDQGLVRADALQRTGRRPGTGKLAQPQPHIDVQWRQTKRTRQGDKVDPSTTCPRGNGPCRRRD